MARKTYTATDVQTLGEHLRALPKKERIEPTALAAADVVRKLRAEIRLAMRRGYTADEIVAAAKAKGVDLTTPTLRKYLSATNPKTTKTGAPHDTGIDRRGRAWHLATTDRRLPGARTLTLQGLCATAEMRAGLGDRRTRFGSGS